MPLSAEEQAQAQELINAGKPKDQVFRFILSRRRSVDLSGPGGVGAAPITNVPTAGRGANPVAEGAADIQRMQQGYNRGLVRAIPSAAAAIALTPVTGGMSLPAAMGTDFAGTAGADLLAQIGMKAYDPSRQINPMESAKVGAYSAGAGGLVRGGLELAQKALGSGLGGIPGPAIDQVNARAPLGGPKAYGLVRERPPEAEFQLAESAQKSVQTARSPSYPKAQAAVGAYQKQVDTAPIYQHILSRLRSPIGNAKSVPVAEAAANKALEDLADTLPDKMTMSELEDYLQRIRLSVRDQIGQTGGSLKAQDVKSVSNFVRQYRDQLLLANNPGTEGPAAFKASSTEMEAIKRFRKLLLDSKGNLKTNAEQIVRRMPTNRVLMGLFDRYDAAMGTNYGQQARDIGLSRSFNPSNQQASTSLIHAVNDIARKATITRSVAGAAGRTAAKTMSVALPPRGFPSQAAASYEAFQKAMEQEQNR